MKIFCTGRGNRKYETVVNLELYYPLSLTKVAAGGRFRISPRWGYQPSRGHQHTILPNFPKNCMKLNEFHYVDPPLTALYMSCMYESYCNCIDFFPNNCKRVSYYKLLAWKLILLSISSSTAEEYCESARSVQLIVLIMSKSVWVPVLEILWWTVRNHVITYETFF